MKKSKISWIRANEELQIKKPNIRLVYLLFAAALITLKVIGVINLDWEWVLFPLWGIVVLSMGVLILFWTSLFLVLFVLWLKNL